MAKPTTNHGLMQPEPCLPATAVRPPHAPNDCAQETFPIIAVNFIWLRSDPARRSFRRESGLRKIRTSGSSRDKPLDFGNRMRRQFLWNLRGHTCDALRVEGLAKIAQHCRRC